jgi:fructose/tagatose bisphosphate aldolase
MPEATQKFMGRNQMLQRLGAQVGSEEEARRLLIERGHMTKDGKWTAAGEKRNAMTAGERAIDRAATASGKQHGQYKYDPKTNRATLKRKF